MSFNETKENRDETKERLRKQMAKDWLEVVRGKMIDVAARFGIKWSDDAKVKSRRIR